MPTPLALLHLLLASSAAIAPASAHAGGSTACDDPVPIDTRVVTREMAPASFVAAHQAGGACYVWWDGGSAPILAIFGPTWAADRGQSFRSAKEAADDYGTESARAAEPLPGAAGAYMVFDPATRTRHVFVEYQGKVYMILSRDQVPIAVLAKALLGSSHAI